MNHYYLTYSAINIIISIGTILISRYIRQYNGTFIIDGNTFSRPSVVAGNTAFITLVDLSLGPRSSWSCVN